MIMPLKHIFVPFPTLLLLTFIAAICAQVWHVYYDARKTALLSNLCDFAASGDAKHIQEILRQGADPNMFNAIESARHGGHPEVIPLLKQVGAKE